MHFRLRQRLHDDFRADARGIAHGDRDRRTAHANTPFCLMERRRSVIRVRLPRSPNAPALVTTEAKRRRASGPGKLPVRFRPRAGCRSPRSGQGAMPPSRLPSRQDRSCGYAAGFSVSASASVSRGPMPRSGSPPMRISTRTSQPASSSSVTVRPKAARSVPARSSSSRPAPPGHTHPRHRRKVTRRRPRCAGQRADHDQRSARL